MAKYKVQMNEAGEAKISVVMNKAKGGKFARATDYVQLPLFREDAFSVTSEVEAIYKAVKEAEKSS